MQRMSRIELALAVVCTSALSRGQTTTLASVSSSGAAANGRSFLPSISDDGRFVCFESAASDLVAGDTNTCWDVFVHDRESGTTERVSLGSSGAQSDADCFVGTRALSADGRYVVFHSQSGLLVDADTNNTWDVFVRDRVAGTTARVSVSSSSGQADGASWQSTISRDGRCVAFQSYATNLVANDANANYDVFVHDLVAGVTERVSVATSGSESDGYSAAPSLSADGRIVAFWSSATNLVSADVNAAHDVFVRDRLAGITQLVSVNSSGQPGDRNSSLGANGYANAALSADGRFVVFESQAENLVIGDTNYRTDIFVRDRIYATTERVSVGDGPYAVQSNGESGYASISADGRVVSFASQASNLVPGDTNNARDLFARDRAKANTERWSINTLGAQANSATDWFHCISGDGSLAVFASSATNLNGGDTNAQTDVFVHTRRGCSWQAFPYCTGKSNSAGCWPVISGVDGRDGAFTIEASQVLEQEAGLLFYGTAGPGASWFQGGTMCVHAPRHRTALQVAAAGGTPPCTGTYRFDFAALAASGLAPELIAGERVWTQYWMRDGANPFGSALTGGLTFVICY